MNRIRQLRKERGWSQETLAEMLNLKHPAISKYEKGIVALNETVILQLSDIFDVSTDYILGKSPYRDKKPINTLPALTKEQQELYDELMQLDSKTVKKVLDYADFLKQKYNP